MIQWALVFAAALAVNEANELEITAQHEGTDLGQQVEMPVEDDEVIGGQMFLRNMFMPYGGMGGYGSGMGMYGGGYGSSMGNYNRGNQYSSSTGWDRGYNNVNSNSYNMGGYGSGYGNQYGMGMGGYGGMYRRRLAEDLNELPDGFLTTGLNPGSQPDPVESEVPHDTVPGELDAPLPDGDETIDGQTHHYRYPAYRRSAYYPSYGFGYSSPYSRYSPYGPAYGGGYRGYPGYPMMGRYYRRLSESEDPVSGRSLRGSDRRLEAVSVLPALPVASDMDFEKPAPELAGLGGAEFVDGEEVFVDGEEIEGGDEEIDGQHHHRRRYYSPVVYPVAYPSYGGGYGGYGGGYGGYGGGYGGYGGYGYPGGGYGGSGMGMYGGGYGSNMGAYNQGNQYSSSTGWDRGYSNTNANNYNMGNYGSGYGNNYGMQAGSHMGHMH